MYRTKIHRKLDQVLVMMPQVECDNKKEKQIPMVLRAFANEKEPRKPAEIAEITGFPQASVRRIIQVLVRSGKVQPFPYNKYSIII